MSQVTTRFIKDNAVTGEKILLENNEALRAKNSSGQNFEILKVDGSNVIQLLSLPQVALDPTSGADLVRKSYLDSAIAASSDTLTLTIGSLQQAIESEETRATSAEAALQLAIDAEVSRALLAESVLAQDILSKVDASSIGIAGGIAPLNEHGQIPLSMLPEIQVPVDSVNGQTGNVVLSTADVSESGDFRYFTAGREQTLTNYADSLISTESSERQYQDGLIRSEFATADDLVRGEFAAADSSTLSSAQSYTDSEISTLVTSQKGQANGFASLDVSGKLNVSQLPDLAITDVFVVQELSDRDALNSSVQSGDVVKVVADHTASDGVTMLPRTYIRAIDGSNVGYWVPLETESDVDSVNGKVGHIVLETSDIQESADGPLYFTESRAKAAVVIDSVMGGETDQAPSVASTKAYVDSVFAGINAISETIRSEFQAADLALQTMIQLEETARIAAIQTEMGERISGDMALQSAIDQEIAARQSQGLQIINESSAYVDSKFATLRKMQIQKRQTFDMTGQPLTHVSVESPIVGEPWLMIDGTMLEPSLDYTFSEGSTVINFAGEMLPGGATALVQEDRVIVFYMTEVSPTLN